MLDLSKEESHNLIKVCFIIEKLRFSAHKLIDLKGDELEAYYSDNRYKLGLIAMEADRTLNAEKKAEADKIIKRLYKPMTGQISVTDKDFDKISDLFLELEDSCFSCWVI